MKIPKLTLIIIVFIVSCTPKTIPLVKETFIPLSTSTSTPALDNNEKGTKNSNEPTSTNLPTKTLLPTITPYPTFEIKDVKTLTPFAPVRCPAENPNYELSTSISKETTSPRDLAEIVLRELNIGASFSQAKKEIEKALQVTDFLEIMDLTGDGVPELNVHQVFNIVVIGCDNGGYKTILDYSSALNGGQSSPSIVAVQDMNLNGIPDVVLAYIATTGGNTVVDVLEWDGNQFNSLIRANHGENSPTTSRLAKALYWYSHSFHNWSEYSDTDTPVMEGGADIVICDLDRDGTKELILTDDGPHHWDTLFNFGPWRGKQVIFKWDGIHYLYSSLELDPPVFRFQAIQDADRFFLMGEYDKALKLYQDAIFSDRLEWWSPEKMTFIKNSYFARIDKIATPISPQPNKDEYLSLVAYARYRILLLHLTQGWSNDALINYNILMEKYPEGSTGYQFANMATILWNEYQETKNLELSCMPVIEYVKSHPEILFPLGNDEHGFQSHVYESDDVCPFK